MTIPNVSSWLDVERYAVYGLGRSGLGACRLLARRGKSVVASDTASREQLGDRLDDLPDGVEVVFGRNDPGDAELVVVSPGIPPDAECVRELERRGLPYVSELDLAFDALETPVAALTGTDGKTTTTSLLGEMAERSSRPSRVAGNIGTPLSDAVGELDSKGLVVAEVSANQLWTSHHFHPVCAGFTNVASDHLDYFDSPASYHEAKRRLLQQSGAGDSAVVNDEDEIVRQWGLDVAGETVGYGFDREVRERYDAAVWSDGESLHVEGFEDAEGVLVRWEDFQLPGRHNRANAMCAAGMALSVGLEPDAIAEALRSFEPLAHRVEYCGTVDGVDIYDDSKATNVHAAIAGLESIPHPFVAVVGGVDKGLDLEPFVAYLHRHAAGVAVIGEIRKRLVEALEGSDRGRCRVRSSDTLEDAVTWAFRRARDTDASLVLSPACSSFDMFEDYVDRGEQFQALASSLPPASRVDA